MIWKPSKTGDPYISIHFLILACQKSLFIVVNQLHCRFAQKGHGSDWMCRENLGSPEKSPGKSASKNLKKNLPKRIPDDPRTSEVPNHFFWIQ